MIPVSSQILPNLRKTARTPNNSPTGIDDFPLKEALTEDETRFSQPTPQGLESRYFLFQALSIVHRQKLADRHLALDVLRNELRHCPTCVLHTKPLEMEGIQPPEPLAALILNTLAQYGEPEDFILCETKKLLPPSGVKTNDPAVTNALRIAIEARNVDAAQVLIERLAHQALNQKNRQGDTLLDIAYQHNNPDLLQAVKPYYNPFQQLTSYLKQTFRQLNPPPEPPTGDFLEHSDEVQESPFLIS